MSGNAAASEGKRPRAPLRQINKSSPLPYYYQIAQSLRDLIDDSDDLARGGQLAFPSENELCDAFRVTRGTVRHALEILEREGLIYRERGRGTFVRRRRIEVDLTRLNSTTEEMRARGWAPSSRVLGLERVIPRPHVCHQLSVPEDQSVWEIRRLRLASGEPISLQWSYVPCHLTPDLERQDLSASLYYLLRDHYGIQLKTADQIIRARVAGSDEALLLEINAGDPVFVIDRTTYDQNEIPVEHLHSYWRGDRYDLQVRLASEE